MKTIALSFCMLMIAPAWSAAVHEGTHEGKNKNAWSQLGEAARALGNAAKREAQQPTAHVLVSVFDRNNVLTQSTTAEVKVASEHEAPKPMKFEVNARPQGNGDYETIDLTISFWDVPQEKSTGKMEIVLESASSSTFSHAGNDVDLPQKNQLKTIMILKEGIQQISVDGYRIETKVHIDR